LAIHSAATDVPASDDNASRHSHCERNGSHFIYQRQPSRRQSTAARTEEKEHDAYDPIRAYGDADASVHHVIQGSVCVPSYRKGGAHIHRERPNRQDSLVVTYS